MMAFLRYLLIILFLPAAASSQGEIRYDAAQPNYVYAFPRDHGSHSNFKLEWWYYTGNVQSRDGRDFGYELTFFRTGMDRYYENDSSWAVRHLYIAHFVVTDITEKKFYYFEKTNRAGPGIAGATAGALDVWNENWSARFDSHSIRLRANTGDAAIDLMLQSSKDAVIHGENGISQKAEGAGHASHYYSLTRLRTTGSIRLKTKTFEVYGDSWMDHEFGTNQLTQDQVGWDWLGIQLDNGAEVMLYRLRNRDGTVDPHSSGTILESDSPQHLRIGDFVATAERIWKSPNTGVNYPVQWTITLHEHQTQLRIAAVVDDQELLTTRSTGIAYWEGAVRITGVWRGRPVSGKGYLELTGYSELHRPHL